MDTLADDCDLKSLQAQLGLIDLLSRPGRPSESDFLEQLVIKYQQLKVKMYQEKKHPRPHLHIDYGARHHVASYAIDTGERLEGSLTRYDKAIREWVEANREALLKLWVALQDGEPEQAYIRELPAMG